MVGHKVTPCPLLSPDHQKLEREARICRLLKHSNIGERPQGGRGLMFLRKLLRVFGAQNMGLMVCPNCTGWAHGGFLGDWAELLLSSALGLLALPGKGRQVSHLVALLPASGLDGGQDFNRVLAPSCVLALKKHSGTACQSPS